MTYVGKASVTMLLLTFWESVAPRSGDFWQQSNFPNVSLLRAELNGRASSLLICPFCAIAGRLDVTTDANSSVKRKNVATLAHGLNWSESPPSGASSFHQPFPPAKDNLGLLL